MVMLYRKEGPRGAERGMVDDLMHITYLKQWQLINSSPPFRVNDVMHEYSEECVFTYGWTKDLDPESIHK